MKTWCGTLLVLLLMTNVSNDAWCMQKHRSLNKKELREKINDHCTNGWWCVQASMLCFSGATLMTLCSVTSENPAQNFRYAGGLAISGIFTLLQSKMYQDAARSAQQQLEKASVQALKKST